MKIAPRLAELSKPLIPIQEIKEYYNLDGVEPLSDRPYCWSNSITSLDGVLHFLENNQGVSHIPEFHAMYEADWRLLNASHAYSDAVLISGQTIRDESAIDCSIQYDDLIQMRSSLNYSTLQPIQCVLTQTGDFPLDRPLFHKLDQQVWIFTTLEAKITIEANLNVTDGAIWSDISIISFNDNLIPRMLKYLRTRGVRYLDVSTGGKVIQKMIGLKYLDEIRITSAGQIVGPCNSLGIVRPTLFPSSAESYGPDSSPIVAWKGIRVIGIEYILIPLNFLMNFFNKMQSNVNHIITPIRDLRPGRKGMNLTCLVLDLRMENKFSLDGQPLYTIWIADYSASVILKLWGREWSHLNPGDMLKLTDVYYSIDELCRGGKIRRFGEDELVFTHTPNMSHVKWSNNDSNWDPSGIEKLKEWFEYPQGSTQLLPWKYGAISKKRKSMD